MSLSASLVDSIARQMYGRFPEIRDVRPQVQTQAGAKTPGESARFVLTFKGKGTGPGGKSIPRIVRVVADERGKVLKVSTSR